MQALYSVQFEVTPPSKATADDLPGLLRRQVVRWISEWYAHWLDMRVDLAESDSDIAPAPGHRIQLEQAGSQSGPALWSLTWSYPSGSDSRLAWQSRCDIASYEGRTEVSFVIRLNSLEFVLSPQEDELKRPRIVRGLLESFPCSFHGRPVPHGAHSIAVSDVEAFVEKDIDSPGRHLPIILLSRDPFAEQPLASPEEVIDRLAGLAEVYVFRDKWASFRFTNVVGKEHACFNGAVRVFWPGPGASKKAAPLFMPGQLRLLKQRGLTLGHEMLRVLAPISTLRFAPGAVTRRVHDLLEQHRHQELEHQRVEAKAAKDNAELFKIAAEENEQLAAEVKSLRKLLEDKEEEVATARANLEAVWAAQPTAGAEVPVEADLGEPMSVLEAVERAVQDFGQNLVFLKSAHESAKDSPYRHPDRVLQALSALSEVTAKRAAAKDRGESLGSSLEKAFEERGQTYKSRESSTTRGKWGEEYEVKYDGKTESIEQHLALGSGQPDSCLRIHFFFDDAADKAVVAHVGRHKTNTKT